ncbi:sugar ABC transporter ATP-binding protein [Leucobacter sp. GX0328]
MTSTALLTDGGAEDRPAIRLRNVKKSYIEGIPVLTDVNLDIPRGRVTALVGANGSGKSTLVKIISGYQAPDNGSEIMIGDHRVEGQVRADEARAAGMRFVHQDSMLVSGISVLENMLIGVYRTGWLGRIAWRSERRSVQAMLDRWGIDIDLDRDPSELPIATVAKLAVIRALRTEPGERITGLVLDEPTASLGKADSQELLHWVRELANREHVGVLLIGHRIDEILATADRVAVLRAGRIVTESAVADLTPDGLVQQIVGGEIDSFYPEREGSALEEGGAALRVRGLSHHRLTEVSFEVRRGEVLGVTGLVGSGFEDLPYALVDPEAGADGSILIDGTEIDPRRASISERLRLGLALVPADRKRRALALDLSLRENMVLPRLRDFVKRGGLDRRAEQVDSERLLDRFGVRPPDARLAASNLSGGNQQKVVLAKWMSVEPSVLVIHEPTIGVDVGAKSDIFTLIADSAEAGLSTVVASVEYEDLAHLCDRVLVIGDGRIVAELSGDSLTTESITSAALLGAGAVAA